MWAGPRYRSCGRSSGDSAPLADRLPIGGGGDGDAMAAVENVHIRFPRPFDAMAVPRSGVERANGEERAVPVPS